MHNYTPANYFMGGYTPTDGTVEFYGRVKSLLNPEDTILDLGAGRGAWHQDDQCKWRRSVRTIKGHVREVIGADVDEAVLNNQSTDRNILIRGGLDLPSSSINLIVADYVLEHIVDPKAFVDEVRRVLVPGGVFCARTPHKYHYVSLGAAMVANTRHSAVLSYLQPNRKAEDVFPTAYRLNTLRQIRQEFSGFDDFSYLYRSDPAYFFGNKLVYKLLKGISSITPQSFSANIFAFLVKN